MVWVSWLHIMVMSTCFVDMYVKDFQCDVVAKDAEPEILKDTAATAWITGNNCLGKKHKLPQIFLIVFTLF